MKPVSELTQSRLWQQFKWVLDPVGFLEKAEQEYPDIFAANLVGPWNRLIFVNHPDGIRQLFTQDGKQFQVFSKTNERLKPILREYSIMMTDGATHQRQRKFLMPPFHGQRMSLYADWIGNITEDMISKISENQVFSAYELTQSISLEVILKVVFGLDQGERSQQLHKLMIEMMNIFRSPMTSALLFFPILRQDWGTWSPWGHFLKVRNQIDQLLSEEIKERRQYFNPERTDILSLLISAQDEEGQLLSYEQLRDELITLMIAGHETTASALAWSLYWIHKLPDVKNKLLEELSLLKTTSQRENINQLPYLDAVCLEALRLYPVVITTFPRVTLEPVDFMGYQLTENEALVACIYSLHQREDIYPQAKLFKPERFLERKYSPYEFIPFGGGSRRCIGEALAFYEMKLVFAKILLTHDLELADNQPEIPKRRGITLAPSQGVRMRILKKTV
jgi:cytochrome P450